MCFAYPSGAYFFTHRSRPYATYRLGAPLRPPKTSSTGKPLHPFSAPANNAPEDTSETTTWPNPAELRSGAACEPSRQRIDKSHIRTLIIRAICDESLLSQWFAVNIYF